MGQRLTGDGSGGHGPVGYVLHVDCDAFFATCEQRDKPSLRRRPVVVGGTGDRGVVATASYEARALGVRSAMPTVRARRLAPHATFLAGRMAVYARTSEVVMGVLAAVGLVEPGGLDEAWIDLSRSPTTADASRFPDLAAVDRTDPVAVARAIQRQVFAAAGVLCSVGIGSNKLVAKMATEHAKPRGVHLVSAGSEADFLTGVPLEAVPGIGPATVEKLTRAGVRTVDQLRTLPAATLRSMFGVTTGAWLAGVAVGQDNRKVTPPADAKSIAVERTLETDQFYGNELRAELAELVALAYGRLTSAGFLAARTVGVRVRTSDWTAASKAHTLPAPLGALDELAWAADHLLGELRTAGRIPGTVRLVGVTLSGLSSDEQQALPGLATAGELPAKRNVLRADAWRIGEDVRHPMYGHGWVVAAESGTVTVRFESARTQAAGSDHVLDADLARLERVPGLPWAAVPVGGAEAAGSKPRRPARH